MTKFFKLSFTKIGMAVALGTILASSAQADSIRFDPDGLGAANPAYNITGLGFGPGNALAVNTIPGGNLTVGSTFTVYFQTHLTSLTGPGAPPAVPGLNSTFQITEVAQFQETVTSVTQTATGTTATFQIVPNANNKLNIYFNNGVVFNDAAGTGFTAGTIIASMTPANLISSDFQNTTATKGLGTFNSTGAGNNSGTGLAATGSGSTQLFNNAITYDKNFFQPPTGTPTLVSSLFNSNLAAIFDAVSPSLLFTNLTTSSTFAPNIGAINGNSGPDIQFQVSGITQSFSAVPEPASVAMTLIGLGSIGFGSFVARRRRARASV